MKERSDVYNSIQKVKFLNTTIESESEFRSLMNNYDIGLATDGSVKGQESGCSSCRPSNPS